MEMSGATPEHLGFHSRSRSKCHSQVAGSSLLGVFPVAAPLSAGVAIAAVAAGVLVRAEVALFTAKKIETVNCCLPFLPTCETVILEH